MSCWCALNVVVRSLGLSTSRGDDEDEMKRDEGGSDSSWSSSDEDEVEGGEGGG